MHRWEVLGRNPKGKRLDDTFEGEVCIDTGSPALILQEAFVAEMGRDVVDGDVVGISY